MSYEIIPSNGKAECAVWEAKVFLIVDENERIVARKPTYRAANAEVLKLILKVSR